MVKIISQDKTQQTILILKLITASWGQVQHVHKDNLFNVSDKRSLQSNAS